HLEITFGRKLLLTYLPCLVHAHKDPYGAEKSFPPGLRRVCIGLTTYAQPFLEGSVMPFFTELTDITDPTKYVNELKAAFRSPNGKKFAYFNNHPKCPKRPHVLLVDY